MVYAELDRPFISTTLVLTHGASPDIYGEELTVPTGESRELDVRARGVAMQGAEKSMLGHEGEYPGSHALSDTSWRSPGAGPEWPTRLDLEPLLAGPGPLGS